MERIEKWKHMHVAATVLLIAYSLDFSYEHTHPKTVISKLRLRVEASRVVYLEQCPDIPPHKDFLVEQDDE